ncbi:MAG: hypothetical protein M3280_08975 [Actinomycetota bacterium]|nr:hypothetical protein [Actinomycetota bacterium]
MKLARTESLPEAPAQAEKRSLPSRAVIGEATRYCLTVFLGVRIGLVVLTLAAASLVPPNAAADVEGWPAPESEPGWSSVVTAFERWDALWFLRIADSGYAEDDASAAFFPAYPVVVGGLSAVIGGHPLPAALIISHIALFAALVVLYLLTRLEYDEDAAKKTVLYMALFPTAFFFFAPYSESMFLFFAAASVLCARTGRWSWAGVLGALAAATRSIGIALLPALALEAWVQSRRDDSRLGLASRLGWSAFVAVGTLAYLAYWKSVSGDWLAPMSEQANWQREATSPLWTLWEGTRLAFLFLGDAGGGYHMLDLVIVVPVVAAGIWAVTKTRAVYATYVGISLLLPLILVFDARPFMSVPRFAVVVWPLFWGFVAFARRFNAHAAVTAGSAAGLGLLTMLFVNWYWIF